MLLGEVRTERLVRSIEAVGTVSAIDSVTAGTGITTLDALDPIALRFTVPEQEVGRIAPGTAVAATSPAFSGRIFEAEARALTVRIDPASRTLEIESRLPNPDGDPRPGMLAECVQPDRHGAARRAGGQERYPDRRVRRLEESHPEPSGTPAE